MQINQANLSALYKGYRTLFERGLHGAEVQSRPLAMRVPSGSAEEVYAWLGALPGMKELVGEVQIENAAANSWSIANKEFESTVAVKQAHIERDTYGVYNPMFEGLGVAAREHEDELIADLLADGFTAKDYTGLAFFAANKPHDPDNSKSAKFTNKGTKKLTAASYVEARAAIKGLKNAKGRPMGIGRELTLVVSPAKEQDAREILEAERNSAGATNVNRGTAKLLVLDRLEGEPWFLLDLSRPVKPVIFQDEKAVALASLTSMDSDHVFKHHEFLYQAYGRYNAGYGLPQLAWGSNGTTAG